MLVANQIGIVRVFQSRPYAVLHQRTKGEDIVIYPTLDPGIKSLGFNIIQYQNVIHPIVAVDIDPAVEYQAQFFKTLFGGLTFSRQVPMVMHKYNHNIIAYV